MAHAWGAEGGSGGGGKGSESQTREPDEGSRLFCAVSLSPGWGSWTAKETSTRVRAAAVGLKGAEGPESQREPDSPFFGSPFFVWCRCRQLGILDVRVYLIFFFSLF